MNMHIYSENRWIDTIYIVDNKTRVVKSGFSCSCKIAQWNIHISLKVNRWNLGFEDSKDLVIKLNIGCLKTSVLGLSPPVWEMTNPYDRWPVLIPRSKHTQFDFTSILLGWYYGRWYGAWCYQCFKMSLFLVVQFVIIHSLFRETVWFQTCDNPFPEPPMIQFVDAHKLQRHKKTWHQHPMLSDVIIDVKIGLILMVFHGKERCWV